MDEKHHTKTLLMIRLLRKNGRMKMNELATQIGTGDRTIRRWKEMFIEMGYNIESTGGRKGGYDLIEENLNIDEWLRIKEFDINIYEKLNKILIERV